MNRDFVFLWAQWGILNYQQYQWVLETFGDLESAWAKIDRAFLLKLGFQSSKVDRLLAIKKTISFQQLPGFNFEVLCIDNSRYPSLLKEISDPPVFLFVRGQLPSFHKSLAVVGTRRITQYGRVVTEQLVPDLVRNGFVVVSGLALGIDAVAHEATLQQKGVTVAVLGSGIDRVIPTSHEGLAQRILNSGGALISEYPLGSPALKHHFPARNRIVAGLSRGVLVVEGGVRSGALITARLGLEYNRAVFAVPHSVHRNQLSGTNHLIRRSEAKLIEKVEHVLEEFQMQPQQKQRPIQFNEFEQTLLALIAEEGKSIDELTLSTRVNVARLSEVLIHLQLRGVVREIGHKWVIT